MSQPLAYLDYNATAPVRSGVAEVVADALSVGGNPSSVHRSGRAARAFVERARDQVAALVGAGTETVVFTSGGTEANNLALKGLARAGRRLIVSAVEHASVAVPAEEAGADIIPVDADGIVDLTALESLLADNQEPALVSVMLANNETGVVQPVAEAAEVAHRHGALMHCDAVQGPGRLVVDVAALNVDLLTLSGHKLGGPQGVGALVIGPAAHELKAIVSGGGQERGLRPGTENVSGIAGFGLAAELAGTDMDRAAEIAALRDGLEATLTAIAPELVVAGVNAQRLCNTSTIIAPGLDSETQVMALDLAGVAVSAGAACSSGKVASSDVLAAMGMSAEQAGCAIRVSLGTDTQKGDIDRFVMAWRELYERLSIGKEALSAA